jgi:hypothetical protein
MSYYRAYMIGSDGHFTKSVDLSCDKDEAAREKSELVNGHDVELWQRARKVAVQTASEITHGVQATRGEQWLTYR